MRKRAWTAFAIAVFALTARAQTFEVRRGVIVDARRAVAYVAGADGDVEAIDVASGRALWTSPAAALPLAIHGNLVAAQSEDPRLHIVVLSATDGRTLGESVTDLPQDVRASIVDTPRQSFHVSAVYERDAFVVSWTDRETLTGGVAPPPGQAPPVRVLTGTTRVAAVATTLQEPAGSNTPCIRGTVAGARGEAVTLKRIDTCSGEAPPDVVLAKSALVALQSADGAHVLVSDREGTGYRWSVYAVANAQKVGELRRDVSAAPFFVTRELIVFVSQPHGFRRGDQWVDVPLELVAVRLGSGEEAWHRAIRDLEWRGTMPPREGKK